jgi:uncharacterized lipoprotein YehR (DUF1307 family)
MRRILALIATLILAFSLTACGSKTYNITTHSGDTFTAKGSPEYDVKTNSYKFNDENGKEVILNKDEIKVIKEE